MSDRYEDRRRMDDEEDYAEYVRSREAERRSRGRQRPGREGRRGHHRGGVVLIVLALIAALVGGCYYYFIGRMQSGGKIDVSGSINVVSMTGYHNIALFGVDSRDQDLSKGNNRSDSIMIASINADTGKIRLVSVYRDTVLDISGDGEGEFNKCNSAYAYGGAQQAVKMLNYNLDMDITDYITIGFEGLADAIDAVDGLDLPVSEEERGYVNKYVADMAAELGTPNDQLESVDESGTTHLNGIQAVAYSRIRYTSGDDFRRAERQRTVLEGLLEKAKDSSPAKMLSIYDAISKKVSTSLSSTEILQLLTVASKASLDGTGGFPQESLRRNGTLNGASVVVPVHLSDNVEWLHKFLYDKDSYDTTDIVDATSEDLDSFMATH